MRVAIAVERDLDVAKSVRKQTIDKLFAEQQAVGDDSQRQRDATLLAGGKRPLGLVVDDRDVQEGLAAEERQRQALRLQLVETLLDPRRQPCAVVERHPVGVLVVIAVIALEAVVAGEVALQGRQHRHPHLLGVFAVVGEELVQGLRVGRPAGHDEAMLGQRDERLALVVVQSLGRQRGRIVRHTLEKRRRRRPTR